MSEPSVPENRSISADPTPRDRDPDRATTARSGGSAAGPALSLLPLLATGAFAAQASIRLADPMLPQLAVEFGTQVTDLTGVITAFALAYGLMQIVYGPMADRLGKLRVMAWATGAASLGSLACGFAVGPDSLALLRLITGAACASLIPLALAWLGDQVPYERRQSVLARFMIGSTLGIVFGQVAGGVFADTIGWRMSFLLPAIVFAAVAWALRRHLALDSGVATPTSGNPLAAFAKVLRNRWARTVLLLAFLEGALNFGTLALLPAWLHLSHGLSLWQAGMAAAGYGLGGLLFALSSPWLVPRLGEKGLACLGGLLALVGLSWLGGPDWVPEAGKATLAGAGFFMMHSTFQTVGTQMVPEFRGTAIAAFALALFLGQSVGVSMMAALSETLGYAQIKPAGGVGLLALGIVLSLLLWRRARTAEGARSGD